MALHRPRGQPRQRRGRRARAIRSSTTPARRRAASGRRPTAARTGRPIFDGQPVQSIGSLAVARRPTRTSSGRAPARRGSAATSRSARGMYKSTDAGKTWTQMGLEKTGRIPRIVIDPEGSRHRARLRAGPRVRPAAGARRLPHDRRRQDLDEGALRGREHRLLRPRDGPVEPAHPLRRHVAARDPHVGPHERRPGQRAVRVARRRRHVEAAHRARAADEAGGQSRGRDRALEPEPRLRADRDRRRHPLERRAHRKRPALALGRRRPAVDAGEPRPQRDGAARTTTRAWPSRPTTRTRRTSSPRRSPRRSTAARR